MNEQEQDRERGVLWVQPWAADQGDYVRIAAADFDPAAHTEYGAAPAPAKPAAARRAKG